MEYPSFDDYTAAIAEHGERPITVEMTVVELTMLISAYNMLTRFLKALKVDPEP